MPVVPYESNAPIADETDGRGDVFPHLRVFCERTGVDFPDRSQGAGTWGWQQMAVLNALAEHLEALERIVLAHAEAHHSSATA